MGRSHGSDPQVADLQRGRLLGAMFALVGERGYEGMTVRGIAARAGVPSGAFYQCFGDREDCFLAAFNHAVAGLELEARAGWESELGWTARVRAALAGLLVALDREPAVRRLVVVEALGAGPRVLARRARVLESLAGVIDQGRANARTPRALPPLAAEGVVGATFAVVHARLLELRPEPLVELLGALMATIVLPYRGKAAAERELVLPAPASVRGRSTPPIAAPRPWGSATPVDYRLTARTRMALAAVAGRPGLNNREVSEIIGLADQGQVSRILKRLQERGLVENTQVRGKRLARAWRLTADGEAAIDARRRGRPTLAPRRETRGDGALPLERARRGKRVGTTPAGASSVGADFQMTALARRVLDSVADLNAGESNPAPNNREVATAAGVKDEGQASRLLARLQTHGLLRNAGGPTVGGNAWQLTERGEELLSASRPTATGAKQ